MPNFDAIVAAVTTVGFPIVLVIVLVFFCWKVYQDSKCREDKLNKQIDNITAQNREQTEKFADSLDNFGHTLSKIDGRLSVLENAVLTAKN